MINNKWSLVEIAKYDRKKKHVYHKGEVSLEAVYVQQVYCKYDLEMLFLFI